MHLGFAFIVDHAFEFWPDAWISIIENANVALFQDDKKGLLVLITIGH